MRFITEVSAINKLLLAVFAAFAALMIAHTAVAHTLYEAMAEQQRREHIHKLTEYERLDKLFPYHFQPSILSLFDVYDATALVGEADALFNPTIIAQHQMDRLSLADQVIGVQLGDTVRAYPIRMLDVHYVINDTIEGVPIAVTWDPLSRSAAAFVRRAHNGRELNIAPSGLYWKGHMLVFDLGSYSLISPLKSTGVTGPMMNERLSHIPVFMAYWQRFTRQYPTGSVVSLGNSLILQYPASRWDGEWRYDKPHTPARFIDERLHPKTEVLGVRITTPQGQQLTAALLWRILHSQSPGATLRFEIGRDKIPFTLTTTNLPWQVRVGTDPGNRVEAFPTSWHPWTAVHPNTILIDKLP